VFVLYVTTSETEKYEYMKNEIIFKRIHLLITHFSFGLMYSARKMS